MWLAVCDLSHPRQRFGRNSCDLGSAISNFRKSQKTRESTVQAITGVQSWISPPPLTAPKHYKTSILGAVIVSERGFLEPPFFPERRVVGLLSFAQNCQRFASCDLEDSARACLVQIPRNMSKVGVAGGTTHDSAAASSPLTERQLEVPKRHPPKEHPQNLLEFYLNLENPNLLK